MGLRRTNVPGGGETTGDSYQVYHWLVQVLSLKIGRALSIPLKSSQWENVLSSRESVKNLRKVLVCCLSFICLFI